MSGAQTPFSNLTEAFINGDPVEKETITSLIRLRNYIKKKQIKSSFLVRAVFKISDGTTFSKIGKYMLYGHKNPKIMFVPDTNKKEKEGLGGLRKKENFLEAPSRCVCTTKKSIVTDGNTRIAGHRYTSVDR